MLLVVIGGEKPKQQMDCAVSLTQILQTIILSSLQECPHRVLDLTRQMTTGI